MHYMKLSDDFEKEMREKGNVVTKSQHVAVLTFAIWLEKYVAEHGVHWTGQYCVCNANATPVKVGSNICVVCELPRQ